MVTPVTAEWSSPLWRERRRTGRCTDSRCSSSPRPGPSEAASAPFHPPSTGSAAQNRDKNMNNVPVPVFTGFPSELWMRRTTFTAMMVLLGLCTILLTEPYAPRPISPRSFRSSAVKSQCCSGEIFSFPDDSMLCVLSLSLKDKNKLTTKLHASN